VHTMCWHSEGRTFLTSRVSAMALVLRLRVRQGVTAGGSPKARLRPVAIGPAKRSYRQRTRGSGESARQGGGGEVRGVFESPLTCLIADVSQRLAMVRVVPAADLDCNAAN
jgi:hypothetical protein